MAKADRFDRAVEFWRTRRIHKFLLSQTTIDLLKHSIDALQGDTLTLAHVQALSLAVSLFEAQARDCLRAAIDSRHRDLDVKSEFVSDIKIDPALFSLMRSRRFSLGEFVFITTGISTLERLWSAVTFSLQFDHSLAFPAWLESSGRSRYDLKELKSSLAWIYLERNRFTHELFDDTARALSTSTSGDICRLHLSRGYEFLTYVQSEKCDHFSSEYDEHNTRRGEIGKEINDTNRRLDALAKQMHERLDTYPRDEESGFTDDYIETVRDTFSNFIEIAEEFAHARVNLASYFFGPRGTIRNEIAAGTHHAALQEIERLVKGAVENFPYSG
jgi:hypothetical protein